MSNLTIKHASRLIARYKTCLINTVPHTSVELRRYTMNPEYYEDLFAGVVAQQITLFLPLIVERRCIGCCLGAWGAHDLCTLPSKDVVDRVFPYTLTMVDRDGAEAMFYNFIYPRPSFLFDEDWCGDLWFDANWRGQVRHKVAVLREAALGR